MALRQMRSESPKIETESREVFLIGSYRSDAPKEVLARIARDKNEHDEVKEGTFRPGAD